MLNNLEPKPWWKLADYMQALSNVVNPNDIPDPINDNDKYEKNVIERIDHIKIAVQNVEFFLKSKNED